VTEFYSWIIFHWIIQIGTCWPDKSEDKYHWAAWICIKIGHFIKILFGD